MSGSTLRTSKRGAKGKRSRSMRRPKKQQRLSFSRSSAGSESAGTSAVQAIESALRSYTTGKERRISHESVLKHIQTSGYHNDDARLPFTDLDCGYRKFYVQQDIDDEKNPLWLEVVRGLGSHGGSSFSSWTFHKFSLAPTVAKALQSFRFVRTGDNYNALAKFRMKNGQKHEDDAYDDLLDAMPTSWGAEGYTALLSQGSFRPAISPDGEILLYSEKKGVLYSEKIAVELKCGSTCKVDKCKKECKLLAEQFLLCLEDYADDPIEEAVAAATRDLESTTSFDPETHGLCMDDDRINWVVFCKRSEHFKAYTSLPGCYAQQTFYEMYSVNARRAVLGSRGANKLNAWFVPYDRPAHLCGALFQRALFQLAKYTSDFARDAMALDLRDVQVQHTPYALDEAYADTVSDILLAAEIDTGPSGGNEQGYAMRKIKRMYTRVVQLNEQMKLFTGHAIQGQGGGRANKKGFTKLSKTCQRVFGRSTKLTSEESLETPPTPERIMEDLLKQSPLCHKKIDFERPDPTDLCPLFMSDMVQQYNSFCVEHDEILTMEDYALHAVPWFFGPTFKLRRGTHLAFGKYHLRPAAPEVRVEAITNGEGKWRVHVRVGEDLNEGVPWDEFDEDATMQELRQAHPDAHILGLPEDWRLTVNDDELVFDAYVRQVSFGDLFGYDAYSFSQWQKDFSGKLKAPPFVWFWDENKRLRHGFDGSLDGVVPHTLEELQPGTLVTVVVESMWESKDASSRGGNMLGVVVHNQTLPPLVKYTLFEDVVPQKEERREDTDEDTDVEA